MSEIRKYEAAGSVMDAVSRFDQMIETGKIAEDDDFHGKEIEGMRKYLSFKGDEENAFNAMITAYKLGYMRAYDNHHQ